MLYIPKFGLLCPASADVWPFITISFAAASEIWISSEHLVPFLFFVKETMLFDYKLNLFSSKFMQLSSYEDL